MFSDRNVNAMVERTVLDTIPKLAGIYLFKDKDNNIIYVGKAKCLKKRLSSYFQKKDIDWKVQQLITEAESIQHIVTKNETEALLLEAQVIKEKQPKFNSLLKEGQPFIYILFSNETMPQIKLARNKKEKGIYFGPFLKKQQARKVHEFLIRTFKLKTCNQKIKTGCLNYHLNLCAGTCLENFNNEEYIFKINLAKDILKGNHQDLPNQILQKMDQYNKEFKFESARNLYEYLMSLDYIIETVKTHFSETKYAKDIAYTSSKMSEEKISPNTIGESLKEFLKLEKTPSTIDCFDISHFQSHSIVGSCIRFTNGVPEKTKFRKFRIKTLEQQNDYAALQEIVQRRYKNGDLPDLILIDGGKGQLNAVKSLFPNAIFISLAKKEEKLFSSVYPEGVYLDIQTEVGKLLIALRDYAHHFAITYHRARRNKTYLD